MDLSFPKRCTVFGTLGVVLCLSKICGLVPLEIKRVRQGWRIRVSPTAILYSKVTIFVFCILIFVSLVLELNVDPLSFHFGTTSDAAAWLGIVVFLTLSLIAENYSGTNRMQCVITSLTQLQKVNAKLRQYSHVKKIKSMVPTILACSFVGVNLVISIKYCVSLYYSILQENKLTFSVLVPVLYGPLYLVMALTKLMILKITLILMMILNSFNHLNHCMRNLLEQISNGYTINEYPLTAATIKELRILHDSLCGVIRNIDDSHGAVFVTLIIQFVAALVITFYYIITHLLTGEIYLYNVMVQVVWALVHITSVIVIIEPCHLTYVQMQCTKRLIAQMLIFTAPEQQELIQALELFYMHLMKDVVYTPMGIFYLDRTVFVSIVCGVTTYLFIMIDV